jgi:hypothetical protein
LFKNPRPVGTKLFVSDFATNLSSLRDVFFVSLFPATNILSLRDYFIAFSSGLLELDALICNSVR